MGAMTARKKTWPAGTCLEPSSRGGLTVWFAENRRTKKLNGGILGLYIYIYVYILYNGIIWLLYGYK